MNSRPLLLLGMCLLASSLAFGETSSESENENQAQSEAETDKWQFVVAPLYLWAAGISGTSGIGPVTAPLNITFENVLDNLDGVFTIHAEAKKNKTGFFTDFMYLDLSPETTGPGGIPISISLENAVWEVGASYRVRKASPVVEVLAGARTSFLSVKTLPIGPTVDETWVDGFGGVRLGHRFGKNDNWRLSGRADVGAGQSDLTWSSTLLMSYRVKEWLSVDAGYKWLSYDYETGSGFNRFAYDVTYQGPIAGFELHW